MAVVGIPILIFSKYIIFALLMSFLTVFALFCKLGFKRGDLCCREPEEGLEIDGYLTVFINVVNDVLKAGLHGDYFRRATVLRLLGYVL